MVNELIVTFMSIGISMSIFMLKLNNLNQPYTVICDQGLFTFEKISDSKQLMIKNIYEDIYKCPNYQFVNESKSYEIEKAWTSEMYNTSHRVCVINLGNQGVTEEDFFYILENKCSLTPNIYTTEKKALVDINHEDIKHEQDTTIHIYLINTTVIY